MDPVIDDKTLVLAISQSGETIDTLEALKYARSQGAKSIAVINVKGSSIAVKVIMSCTLMQVLRLLLQVQRLIQHRWQLYLP